MADLVTSAHSAEATYDAAKDQDLTDPNDISGLIDANRENIFGAGMSKRIWNELYKVVDSSDVVVQVLDARDPMGTRSQKIEGYMKKEKAHKHMILLLNKVICHAHIFNLPLVTISLYRSCTKLLIVRYVSQRLTWYRHGSRRSGWL